MEENVTFAKEDVASIDGMSPTAGATPEAEGTESAEVEAKVESKEPEVKEEVKEEVVKEAPPAPDPTDEKLKAFEEQWSKKFAALSRRERFLTQKEKDANEKGKISEGDRKELEELRAFNQRFNENPYGLMDEKGHTYENWTQKILAGEPTPKPSQTPKELEEIRARMESLEKERETQTQAQVQAQRQQIYQNQMEEINKVIVEKAENYPLVNLFGDEQLIFDIRAEKFKQDVQEYDQEYALENLMSIDDAATHAETWRENVVREKKSVIDPFKKKLGAMFSEEMSAEEKEKEALKIMEEKENPDSSKEQNKGTLPEATRMLIGSKKRAKTLTNEQQTTVPAREDKPFKTEQERIDHAASLLRHTGS